jgi:uncharacterized repeat protein (TIGR01451 family)
MCGTQGAGLSVPSSSIGKALAGALAAVIGAAGVGAPAFAAGTVAGTAIENRATATYDLPSGGQATVDSNTISLTVDELLDVSVALASPGDVITVPGATAQILGFTLTNAGNGSESFRLATRQAIGGDQFDPVISAIALDSNGNNAFDPGVDTIYVAGTNDPTLAPDAQLSVFVLSLIPAGAQDSDRGQADLTAVAVTGSGAPGSSFAGQGQGGGNAVVGATGADAEASGFYSVAAASLTFVKSAVVADPFGGTTQVPGGTITYTLTATVAGSGSLANVRVADPVPAGTSYVPASITLDGAALTDAADGDAGTFDSGSGISVGLGNLSAGTTRIITFRVRIL